jgi:4'-phosphopantetheinyl transferase
VTNSRSSHVDLLNRVERDRRAAYYAAVDRDAFTLGVAITRAVLGVHLGIPPQRVDIDRTCPDCPRPHGQPRLAEAADISFSVTHSGLCVAVAFAAGGTVGIDVERRDRTYEAASTDLVLSESERGTFDRLRPASQRSFLRYWVRKEAVLKATGDGLRVPMTDLTVSAPDEPPRLIRWAGRPELPSRVALADLNCDAAYSASLAMVDGRFTAHEFDGSTILRALG